MEIAVSTQRAHLIRHGETDWSLSGQHPRITDLPLTARGEEVARRLGSALAKETFAHVLTSPMIRALRTCEFAGLADRAGDRDLMDGTTASTRD